MSQRSFASAEHALKKKQTRREKFLADMERLVPWTRLIGVIEPLYPSSGRVGRQPTGVSKMLRMYLLQQWYGLADEALEDAIYNDLTRAMFEEINAHLAQQGLLMRAGTIVDATIIAAPSSTKNAKGERDPEMHQAKKGNQWHHGMKAHIGVDAESGIVHSLVSTAANVSDVTQAASLLHGEETDAFGDSGYRGVDKRAEFQDGAKAAQWHIAMQSGKRRQLSSSSLGQMLEKVEKIKAGIRAKVEHPFHVVKNLFGHKKTRYRGLAKNHGQLYSLFGLANLVIAKRRLLAIHGTGAS